MQRTSLLRAWAAAGCFAVLPTMLNGQAAGGSSTLPDVPPAAVGSVSLTYVPGSSVKLEQVIGDCDWQVEAQKGTCQPTTSQTVTRFNILGNGQGGSFEDNGKMIFLFGDTISKDVNLVNYHGADPIAWSTSTNPEAGLLLNFFTNSDGSPLFVKPPGVAMGPDAIPNAGISLNGQIYLVCNIGSDTSLADPQSIDTSVLVQFDEKAQTFTGGRTISPVGGHFIGTSLHASGSNVVMFGAGPYRKSDVYLAMTPATTFASGAGTQYFAGLVNGQPTWASTEAGAAPVVQDNPSGGPAWPNDTPSIGNLSVAYSSALSLWLMTFDGGKLTSTPGLTRGVYFTYAAQPWGPWATPQLIFNDVRDKAYGVGGFIHNPNVVPDPPGDGLNGPMIGSNDIYTSSGGGFAPLMIERFLTVVGNTLKVYYNLSTWNPYTVVKMRAEFTVGGSGPVISLVANAEGESPTVAPSTWVEIKGSNLAPAGDTRIWQGSDFVNSKMPAQLDGVSVTVNGKAAYVYYISPTQINILTPPDAMSGPVQVVVTNAGTASAAFSAQAQAVSPAFFVFNGGPYVAATHANGSYLGPASLYPGTTTPAKPGETVVLYANGFGPTSTPVVSGSLLQSGILSPAPVIKIGGTTATVQFAGLVSPGEFQFNVVVPANMPDGDLAITATYNGLATQAGTLLTVQH